MGIENMLCINCNKFFEYDDEDEKYYEDYDSECNSVVHYFVSCPHCGYGNETWVS